MKQFDFVRFRPHNEEVYSFKLPEYNQIGIVVSPDEVNSALQTILGVSLKMAHVAFKVRYRDGSIGFKVLALYSEDCSEDLSELSNVVEDSEKVPLETLDDLLSNLMKEYLEWKGIIESKTKDLVGKYNIN